MDEIYAHSSDRGEYELLSDHLNEVAELASEFANDFGYGDVARRAGILHDYGKAQDVFQKRVRGGNVSCDHSTSGAKIAYEEGDIITAFVVAGHHAGLADMTPEKYKSKQISLRDRLQHYNLNFSYSLLGYDIPSSRDWSQIDPSKLYDLAFMTRMIFSSLVDADFLCTERFIQRNLIHRSGYVTLKVLNQKLDQFTSKWDNPSNSLYQIRNDVRYACIGKSLEEPGLYSLTVPTGGGKTVASLCFAIKHAIHNGQKRIIYVIPYTSIIDQTVATFQKIFGKEDVIAHHSEVDYSSISFRADSDIDFENNLAMRHQLATENWDAPIIVTTSVQFFESFHASRTSKARKIHNVAKSVVIFDEVQTLPRHYLRACIEVIDSLVSECNVTALLCTATQPALDQVFLQSGSNIPITEIIEDTEELFEKLKRVNYQYDGELGLSRLGAILSIDKQVLCIVNTRKTARDLFWVMQDDPEANYYLSTWMTPAHRKLKLAEIRKRLEGNLPCRVVSTSLIEAGVDVDFPVVYREITRLDSIIQAGGRCNREGKQDKACSVVHVFRFFDRTIPRGQRADVDRMLKVTADAEFDDLETVRNFFEQFYYEMGSRAIDPNMIVDKMQDFCFKQVEQDFEMIPDSGYTIYIPDAENINDIEMLVKGETDRELMRRLGSDSVSINRSDYDMLANEYAIEPVGHLHNTAILIRENAYDARFGLKFSEIDQEVRVF